MLSSLTHAYQLYLDGELNSDELCTSIEHFVELCDDEALLRFANHMAKLHQAD